MDNNQLKLDLLARIKVDHPTMCRRWFDDIRVVGIIDGSVHVQVGEPIQLKYLQKCCAQQFSEAAQSVTGRLLGVVFFGESFADRNVSSVTISGDRVDLLSEIEEDMLISPDYTFDGFVIGPGNRLAHAAATAVSNKPGQAYNPLFIHGGVGLGKTHLLQSICQTAMHIHNSMRIYYVSCNGFMTQFLEAVQSGEMSSFRNRFRSF